MLMMLGNRVYPGLVLGLLVCGCGQPAAQPDPIRPVRAMKVGDINAIAGREFPGRAKAKSEVELSFQVPGSLITLPVDVGSAVKKGEVIATLDPTDFQSAVDSALGNLDRAKSNLLAMERGARPEEIEQLKAAVAQAEASQRQAVAEHERNANLVASRVVSKSDFDISLARAERSTAELRAAKEALNIGLAGSRPEDLEAKRSEIRALEATVLNAKNQLNYTVLRAPFEGEVAARYVENFQNVQAKQGIVRLLDVSQVEITIQVPESLIALVPKVKKVVCRFDALPGRELFGKVTKIGSEASQTTRTYPVTVEIDQPADARILPGMAATVRNHAEETADQPAADLVIPPSALFTAEAGQQSYVWVVDVGTNSVVRRAVKTGDVTPVGLAVQDGLKTGELVVTSGVNSLVEGQKVSILKEGT